MAASPPPPSPSHDRTASLNSNSSHGFPGRTPYSVPAHAPLPSTSNAASATDLSNGSPPIYQHAAVPEDGAMTDFTTADVRSSHRVSESRAGSMVSRRSLDPAARPNSMRGKNAEKPWIGTFNFEDGKPSYVPTDAELENKRIASDDDNNNNNNNNSNNNSADSASSDDADLEKQGANGGKQPGGTKGEDEKDPNVIEWEDSDPENPHNWSLRKKWAITTTFGLMTFAITFASSIFSTATMPTSMEFGVSPEVMTLGTSLFVVGFAFGPIIWGPFSELLGRKAPLFFGYTVFAIFQIPVAVTDKLYTVFICRFFGGFFGSAPLAVVGGALGDMWDPVSRGYAMCMFSGATFIGPVAGPIVGSFITESYLGWRWTAWITAILGFSLAFGAWFVVQESFAPLLLSRRAKKIRYQTKNWSVRAKFDEQQVSFKDILQKYLLRPFAMLVREPILLLVTVYMSVVYGILYLFFESYPIAFQETRGLSPGLASLPFLSILVGVMLGALIICLITRYRMRPIFERDGKIAPEERLIPMIVGGFLLPPGLFWFAWTSNPNINLWPQIVSGLLIGSGIMIIFLQGLNYIIDCYTIYANSAISANTFARSWVGGGFPMFAMGMYHNLGVAWATSLLGFICVALLPVPILFYIYGAKIRSWSKYSPS